MSYTLVSNINADCVVFILQCRCGKTSGELTNKTALREGWGIVGKGHLCTVCVAKRRSRKSKR